MLNDLRVSVVGLGYVGLPVAVFMSEKYKTIGFDIDKNRIDELRAGKDSTLEVEESDLKSANIEFTSEIEVLKKANFHIVAVPTPVDNSNRPDMGILLKASETVGKALKADDIVVYESTVYPGATEEDCIPVLEKFSGLKAGIDFKVGYSPERINPGDKEHTFQKICKVVSAQDEQSLDLVAKVYSSVVEAGVFRAKSIKVAEAAKVIENTQRDINIALMNELALICDRIGIDTLDVLEAARTKWNFLPFKPGLVGGHCIGVDPYYLTHKAEELGYHSQVILSGRRINDSMGPYIAQKLIKELMRRQGCEKGQEINVYGLTFKENCPDLRNSKVVEVIKELKSYGFRVNIHDPMANSEDAMHEYGIELTPWEKLPKADACIIAVAHDFYTKNADELLSKTKNENAIVFDVKGVLAAEAQAKISNYIRL
ncbi:MAG: nucleotide sugar dehydrogenase [Bdellovibrionales bacterium]